MSCSDVIKELRFLKNPKNVKGMARFGINSKNTLGIPVPVLRDMGKKLGKNHKLALQLWDSKIHEARLLACFIDDVSSVTEKQMEKWVKDIDSWDICDQLCSNLFGRTKFAYKKIFQWVEREEEFIRRTGFVLIATLSVHDKKFDSFDDFFPLIKKYAIDERNFVKKAINWALRQIGKRNIKWNKKAIKLAKEIQKIDSKSARWISKDALRELTSEAVQKRLHA